MPQIADLYAKIRGDSTQLTGELNKSKGALGELGGAFEKVSGISLSSFATIAGGVGLVVNYLKDAYAYTAKYATQVQDLSRIIGVNAEEASRLIEASEDVRISYDSLITAMRGAIVKGFEPTIEGLMAMSDQYLAIQDPIERSTFLVESFGRSGLEMGKMMELGADGIKSLMAAQQNFMTQDELDKMEAARQAMLDLDDASGRLKITVASGLAPAWADVIGFFNKALTNALALSNQIAILSRAVWDLVAGFFALSKTPTTGYISSPTGGGTVAIIPNTGSSPSGNWNQIVNRASGSYAEGGILVGERGPEVVNMPMNSYVTPNESASIRLDRGSMEELAKLIADKMVMARA